MSNHTNHRRGEKRRTETGPRWENGNPGKGCNSTHVARARRKWKRYRNRATRRVGSAKKFHNMGRGRPYRLNLDG